MSIVVSANGNSAIFTVPLEELEKVGLSIGDEIEMSKNENNEVVLRSVAEAERKRKFDDAKNDVFEEWHDVFVELARGPNDKTQKPE